MYKDILLPLEVSKSNEEVIQAGIDLAKIHEAKITLLHVVEVFAVLPKERESEARDFTDRAKKYLNQVKEKIEEYGLSASVVVMTGNPADEICRYARRGDVDLITLYSRGFGWVVGSVFDEVVKRSPKPVLSLRAALPSLLADKSVLVVDDEPDVLETVEEELDMCSVQKTTDYETALQYLKAHSYDAVILDIMGVNGIELLKVSVSRGFPTLMLTAHAMTPETLKKSVKLGAVAFLPKEKMAELGIFLEDVIRRGGRPVWKKVFERLGSYFSMRFGWSDNEEKSFFDDIAENLKEEDQ